MTRASLMASLAAFVIVQGGVGRPARERKTPMTPWGEPDLQGTWTAEAELSVPFERPREYGTRQLLTDAEFTQRQSQSERQLQSDNSDFDLETADRSTAGQVGSATSPPPHWLERRKISRRTSLVIDPPDGRVPPLTREAQERATGARTGVGRNGRRSAAGPEPVGALHRRAECRARSSRPCTTRTCRSCRRRAWSRSPTR